MLFHTNNNHQNVLTSFDLLSSSYMPFPPILYTVCQKSHYREENCNAALLRNEIRAKTS
jgi:hypothetical protein